MTDDLIRRARAAQYTAARALLTYGLAGPAKELLDRAVEHAGAAQAAGRPVSDIHQLQPGEYVMRGYTCPKCQTERVKMFGLKGLECCHCLECSFEWIPDPIARSNCGDCGGSGHKGGESRNPVCPCAS